ncbi:MAG: hypothetical protein FIB01_12440 [Gemmatimonadetes bacterium]|nr:hypothetical protein [Gemmatimonadota bacterium]
MVPAKRLWLCAAILAILSGSALPLPAQTGADSLRRAARAAEAQYERTARFLAPGTFGGRGGKCDEVVGRFCLTFDSLSKPPERPERAQVGAARDQALATLQAFAAAAPGDVRAAGPLVRLLVEADRADEAAAVAERFASGTQDQLWAGWLSGLALHASGRDREAEASFRNALARAPRAERAAIISVDWLLEPGERRRLGRLPEAERERYLERFWRLADPAWLTPENEVWVEHVARQVEARLLADVPLVPGMLPWGHDLDELTVRYGAPIARERDWSSDSWSFIEHFDTSALAYAPEALRAAVLAPPLPGAAWLLESPTARSSHAPRAIGRVVPLAHQLTRFPAGDSMIVRLDAAAELDSAGPAAAVLVAWPWRGGPDTRAVTSVRARHAAVLLEVRVPRDSMVFGAEVFESRGRKLQRARYLLEPLEGGAVQLSDILLTRPVVDSSGGMTDFEPLTSSLVPAVTPVGIRVAFTGVSPGEPTTVDVSYTRADAPSPLARAGGWLGRTLGITAGQAPARVRWRAAARADATLHVNLVTPARPGLYYVQVIMHATAGTAVTRRLVRVEAGSAGAP